MPRVLHLLSADADQQSTCQARQLAADPPASVAITVRTIGPGGTFRNDLAALVSLRQQREAFDIVHAWGSGPLTAVAMAGNWPIVYSPSPSMTGPEAKWLRAISSYRDVHVVCPTATLRRRLVETGIPLEASHIVRPAVDFGLINRLRSDTLRAALGFSASDHVLLACGESTRAAGHEKALWATAILRRMDLRYHLLVWGRGPRVAALRKFARRLREPGMLVVAEERLGRAVRFEELPGAANTGVISSTGAVATLPMAVCMAAGLPLIASTTYTVAELVEDRHTALMVPSARPRLLAQRVLDLMGDANLRWAIADRARTEAFEYFSLTRFRGQMAAIYAALAERQPIQVAEPRPGPGLRFHGRA